MMATVSKLQEIYNKYPEQLPKKVIKCEEGWFPIIEEMCSTIQVYLSFDVTAEATPVTFTEIKEKYGVLNISYEGGDPVIERVIKHTQKISYKICEYCGKKGNLYCSTKWRNWSKSKTLCQDHAVKFFYYRSH